MFPTVSRGVGVNIDNTMLHEPSGSDMKKGGSNITCSANIPMGTQTNLLPRKILELVFLKKGRTGPLPTLLYGQCYRLKAANTQEGC